MVVEKEKVEILIVSVHEKRRKIMSYIHFSHRNKDINRHPLICLDKKFWVMFSMLHVRRFEISCTHYFCLSRCVRKIVRFDKTTNLYKVLNNLTWFPINP